jgi:protein-disulfide isomerase/uncharacterized membrane protein
MNGEKGTTSATSTASSGAAALAPARPLLIWLVIWPVVVGLVASAILLVDYVRPAPVFCEEGGGCDALKRTVYASFLGLPTPVYGVAAFVVFAALALQRGALVRRALVVSSALGAAAALFLLGVQLTSGVYCRFCIAADLSLCFTFAAALWRWRAAWDPPPTILPRALAGLTFAAALGAPLAFGFTKKAPLPETIATELARSDSERVTIIDFVDFECPHCRRAHAELAPVVAANRAHIRLVRKMVPLTRMHPHALDAARAACCGDSLGKGDAMADALFTAPVDDLTPEGCEKIALSLGLDPKAYRDCIHDPKTDARIQADTDAFKATKGRGLPTIWIDDEKIEGAPPEGVLEHAVMSAVARKS